jgi:hypothetical protein
VGSAKYHLPKNQARRKIIITRISKIGTSDNPGVALRSAEIFEAAGGRDSSGRLFAGISPGAKSARGTERSPELA